MPPWPPRRTTATRTTSSATCTRPLDAAADALAGALQFEPERAGYHLQLATVRLAQQRFDAARGSLAIATHRPRDAHVAFREALGIDPLNEGARRGLSDALKAGHPVYRACNGPWVYIALAAIAPAFLRVGPVVALDTPAVGWLLMVVYVSV